MQGPDLEIGLVLEGIEDVIYVTEEEFKNILKDSISEALSAFPNQYEIAKDITNFIEELYKNGEKEGVYNTGDKYIRSVKIQIVEFLMCGAILEVNAEKHMVTIGISKSLIEQRNKNKIIDTVAHELMHSNIFFKRFDKKYEIFDMPSYYGKIVNFMNEKNTNFAYHFAYSLYSTYYQETNSLVSQIFTSLNTIVPDDIDLTTEELIRYLKRTNSYHTFYDIISYVVPKIEIMSDEWLKREIVEPFKEFKIDITVKEIRRIAEKMNKIAKEALKKCYKNAVLFYNKHRYNQEHGTAEA